jgi:hypothetical protein
VALVERSPEQGLHARRMLMKPLQAGLGPVHGGPIPKR